MKRIDDPTLPEQLCALYAYWRGKLNSRSMPSRADLDPCEIRPLLPYVMLTEVLEGGKRFRFRLAGTAITEMTGRELSGRYLDEGLPGNGYGDYVLSLYAKMMSVRRPIYSESDYTSDSGLERTAKRLMLPLSSDGETVNMVLSGQLFEHRTSTAYQTPVFKLGGFRPGLEHVYDAAGRDDLAPAA